MASYNEDSFTSLSYTTEALTPPPTGTTIIQFKGSARTMDKG